MAKTIRGICVELELPFCEEAIKVNVYGNYFLAERAYTYAGEYAPTDPPEPAHFEYTKITRRDLVRGVEVDITSLIPPDCEEYISERAAEVAEKETV
jgi:hypothetical protein